ncbi:MAG TPA: aldehyde dehydrogenase family protein, partial [Terracidiphilus sp.]|nr:aldehyde dehydrogenase family protein [Terracidiphilus sp.]
MTTLTSLEIRNFVGGKWQSATSAPGLELTNPATGESLGQSPSGSAAEVDTAVQAAQAAFPAWRATPPGDRVQFLFKLKNLLESHFDELAAIITTENGKTLAESKGELRRGIENVEVACGIPVLMQGYSLEDIAPGIDEIMVRQPLGVCAVITPFNFPLMIPLWFLPYAIATGNTLVLKPSDRVPFSATRLV